MPTKKELEQELNELKAKISDRARKAVQARWAKINEEERRAFGKKLNAARWNKSS